MNLHNNEIVKKIENRAIKAISNAALAGHSLKRVKPLKEKIGISELKNALEKEYQIELEIKSAVCDNCGQHITIRIYGEQVTAQYMCEK